MIILSCGLPKSGSTLLCNLQEELITKALKRNGQLKLRQRFEGRFINKFNVLIALRLIFISMFFGHCVVKTHSTPSYLIRLLINLGVAKATFTVRDPRDIVLSAMDHGAKVREGLRTEVGFAQFTDITVSVNKVKNLLKIFLLWKKFGKVYFVRYENMMTSRVEETGNVLKWLGLNVDQKIVKELVEKSLNAVSSKNFNIGAVTRFRDEMPAADLDFCNQEFGKYLEIMGYKV